MIDNTLVLSFPHAAKPVVWQMDMDEAKTSALEIQQAESDQWTLCFVKTGAKKNVDIATFETKDMALEALMLTSSALEKKDSTQTITPPAKTKTCGGKKKCGFLKVIMWVIGGIFLLFLLFTLSSAMRMTRISNVNSAGQAIQQSVAPVESGVPMSADDFLNAR